MTQKDLEKILKSKRMTIDDYFKNLSCGYDITQNLTKPLLHHSIDGLEFDSAYICFRRLTMPLDYYIDIDFYYEDGEVIYNLTGENTDTISSTFVSFNDFFNEIKKMIQSMIKDLDKEF